jgi:hypothetical protein
MLVDVSRGGMPGTCHWTKSRGRACAAASLLLALVAGGCSSGGTPGAPSAEATHGFSGSGSLSDLFFSGSSAKAPQTATGAQPDVNCPPVEVRGGASTLTISPPGETSAMTLKYQGSFAREGRECAVVDGNLVMKVGVEGRLVVGPRGGPGQVDVPLRFAVVQETPGGMRPIATKFIIVPVIIAPNNGNTIFTHIEDGISFPVPTPTSLLDAYIVYVGFDPVSAEAQAKQPKAKAKPSQKAKPAASAN